MRRTHTDLFRENESPSPEALHRPFHGVHARAHSPVDLRVDCARAGAKDMRVSNPPVDHDAVVSAVLIGRVARLVRQWRIGANLGQELTDLLQLHTAYLKCVW